MMRFLSRSLAAPVLVLALLGLCLGASMASAQVPHDMNYQGRLTDSVGAPLAGPVDLELRIYDVLSGGVALFAENHAVVPLDEDGGFNLLLGNGAATTGTFDASLFAGVNRYLEVVIDGEVLSPRLPFSSVPYAMVAEEAAVVQGAPSLITDVQTLQTQVGSPAPGDPSVVDRLTSQGVTIGTNTVAATTAQASADSASTTAAAAQSTATANEAALTALQATLPSLQDLSGQDLTGADLSGQDLSMANLVGTILVNANLQGANFYGANLSGADLSGADLRGANLDEALLALTVLRQTRVGLSGGISTSMNNATVTVGPDTGGGILQVQQVQLIAHGDQCVLTGLGIPCLSANGVVFSGGGGPQTTVILAPNTQAVGASFLLDEYSHVSCVGGSDFSGSVVAPNVVFTANDCTAAGLKAPGANYQGWGIAPNSDLRGSLVELSSSPSPGSMPPDLSGSNLAGAHLRFVGANVGTLLEGADLTGAWIDSTQIGPSPTVSFRSANLTNIELCDVSQPACLPLSKLAGFDFADATLSGVNFIPYYGGFLPTSLDGVDLSDATLANHAQGVGVNLFGFGADYLASAVLPQTMAFTNLGDLDLSGRDLSQIDFRQATLIGTDFTGANLTGAQFAGANLTNAILTGAILSDADLTDANLTGSILTDAVLAAADLTGADLAGADVGGTDFSGATLVDVGATGLLNAGGAPTDFAAANLAGATLGGNLDGASLRGADLTGANVAAASLIGADVTGAVVATATGIDFSQVTLSIFQDLSGQDLSGQDLSGEQLSFFNLAGTNLTGANLSGANLYRADLTGANLDGADLRSANLNSATLLDATLLGAKIGDSGSGPTSMLNANVAMTAPVPSPPVAADAIQFSNSLCNSPTAAGECLVADGANFSNRLFASGAWGGVRAFGAIFGGAQDIFCGEQSDFSGSDFSSTTGFWTAAVSNGTCIARGSKFIGSELGTIRFADLSGSDFSGVTVDGAGITLAGDFSGSNFTSATFTGPNSAGNVDLAGDFTAANLTSATFTGSGISGTSAGANFTSATFTNGGIFGNSAGSNFTSATFTNCGIDGDASGSDFSNADLSGFGCFNGNLSGSNLKSAIFRSPAGRAGFAAGCNLDGADLRGTDIAGLNLVASLVGADLGGANTLCAQGDPSCPFNTVWYPADLSSAKLHGVDFSYLSSASGPGSGIPGKLTGADLSGAILGSFADQQGIDLSFWGGDPLYLLGATLPKNLAYTNLSGHDLSGMDLSGADLREATLIGADLSGANLTGARLGNIDLSGANLANTILVDADLTGADLAGADVDDADFSRATLANATLTGLVNTTATPSTFASATLSGATLTGNLGGANLSDANLAGTNVSTATLTGANFTRAKLSTAIGLAAADVTGADFTAADLAGVDVSGFSSPITCPDGTTSSSHSSQDCVGHLLANSFAGLEQSIQAPISANATAIGTETTRALAAEGVNAAAVSAEETRALAAEGVNTSAISSNDTDIAANTSAIGAEETRALAAEGVNASAISSNDTDIAANTSAIGAEETRALAAEGVNAAAVSAEETRALAAEGVNTAAIGAEAVRAMGAEDSNALEINDLISELALDVVQVGDPRLSFTGTWTSQAGTWGANRFSSVSRYSSCEGDADCSSHTITLALDNNAWRTVLVSTLDWHRNHYFDVFISFDGGANYTFHNRIETYRPSYTDPYVSSIRTLVSNLPQGQDVRVRMQATRGRIHFEGFALSHAVLPEEIQNRIAVRSEDGTISGDYVLDGDITVGTTSTGSLKILQDIDVSTTGGSGSLSIGNPAGLNIGIDGNEIMARNGSAGSTLYINNNGGDVSIGNSPSGAPSNLDLSGNADIAGSALIGWERISAAGTTHSSVPSTCSFGGSSFNCYIGSATAICGAGKVVLGGGCSCNGQTPGGGYNQTCHGYPSGDSSFRCQSFSTTASAPFTAYATCARMGN